ncbi:MAG: hypothetical protein MZW92_03235 [Comamonadaceae bacterium]|nr:hypothetical protein [Comamonadaceae bacterium]
MGRPLRLAIEREDGLVSIFDTLSPAKDADPGSTFRMIERAAKFLLWSRGGWRIHFLGPDTIGRRLKAEYAEGGSRAFDAKVMGGVYGRPFEVVLHSPATFPEAARGPALPRAATSTASASASTSAPATTRSPRSIDGEPVFSEEIPWTPATQPDPRVPLPTDPGRPADGRRAPAARRRDRRQLGRRLSSDNQVRIASLFRVRAAGPSSRRKVRGHLRRALAAGMGRPVRGHQRRRGHRARRHAVARRHGRARRRHGLERGGRLPRRRRPHHRAGSTSWPSRRSTSSPAAAGRRVVGRPRRRRQLLLAAGRRPSWPSAAGLSFLADMKLPERLKEVQRLAVRGNIPAARVFESIGVYLGYTVPWYEVFYGFRHLLVLGRVMSGPGGDGDRRQGQRGPGGRVPGDGAPASASISSTRRAGAWDRRSPRPACPRSKEIAR